MQNDINWGKAEDILNRLERSIPLCNFSNTPVVIFGVQEVNSKKVYCEVIGVYIDYSFRIRVTSKLKVLSIETLNKELSQQLKIHNTAEVISKIENAIKEFLTNIVFVSEEIKSIRITTNKIIQIKLENGKILKWR